MAIVADGGRGRVYLSPTIEHEKTALSAEPRWKPEVEFFQQALGFRVGNYGMTKWSDLFTNRQLVALTCFSDLVQKQLSNVVMMQLPLAHLMTVRALKQEVPMLQHMPRRSASTSPSQ